eukprot:CAMPEP_0204209530 /NCGR_PEP_ID=MMETSP0361-20130328/73269_1 /ASSEMBLY_ACC=CAM_ASM_000343 /TAXON_ID=268821 /ORGANISM="Scrippsiella Hangoei, Strain SHTV-5" /LENGTH=60 /DNA_ID=CAMNT_0051173503 /DNA_START=1 /DNA_END=180 /DNA_ORIENTATION=-
MAIQKRGTTCRRPLPFGKMKSTLHTQCAFVQVLEKDPTAQQGCNRKAHSDGMHRSDEVAN